MFAGDAVCKVAIVTLSEARHLCAREGGCLHPSIFLTAIFQRPASRKTSFAVLSLRSFRTDGDSLLRKSGRLIGEAALHAWLGLEEAQAYGHCRGKRTIRGCHEAVTLDLACSVRARVQTANFNGCGACNVASSRPLCAIRRTS
jgi:hypothetical protein